MRWWCILCVSVLWKTVTSKAIDNVPEASSTRECCPCPKPGEFRSSVGGLRSLAYPDQETFGTSLAAWSLKDAVDDCPCRPRDADSTGASSMFFPTSMRAIRPFVSLDDEKKDGKPLLHPEVNLASSVLETLRQATNEEYEDALARDAARSVARYEEPNGIIEGMKNLIPVIVSPKKNVDDDGEIAEPTNRRESRLNPVRRKNSLRIPMLNSPKLLGDLLQKPSRKSAFIKESDMDSAIGASIINENVVPPQKGYIRKPKFDFLNILPDSKTFQNNHLSLPKLSDVFKNIEESLSSKTRSSTNTDADKTGNKSGLPKILHTIPILNSRSINKHNKIDKVVETDNIDSPSSVVERSSGLVNDRRNAFSEKKSEVKNKNTEIEAIKALTDDIKKRLLNTKIPKLNVKSESRDAASDLLTDIIKTLEKSRLDLFNTQSKTTTAESPESINKGVKNTENSLNKNEKFSTKIVDTVSSGSTPNIKLEECLANTRDGSKDNITTWVETNPNSVSTEIIDTVPSTSNVNEVMNSDISESNELNSLDTNEEDETSDVKSKEITTDIATKADNSNWVERNPKTEIIDTAPSTSNVNEVIDSDISESNELNSLDTNEEDEVSDDKSKEIITDIATKADNSDINNDLDEIMDENDTSQNVDLERDNCSNDEEIRNNNLNNDFIEIDPKQLDTGSVFKDKRSEISSNIKAVAEDEQETEEDDENCDPTEHLKGNNQLHSNEKLIERLDDSIKSKDIGNERSTLNAKEDRDFSQQLSIDDLQKMSNSLLDQEKLLIDVLAERKNTTNPNWTNQAKDLNESFTDDAEILDDKIKDIDTDVSETKTVNQVTSKSGNECRLDTLPTKRTESVSEASERVSSALKPESVLHNSPSLIRRIGRPSSLFDGTNNIFDVSTLNLPDILSNPLPALRLPYIFGDRASGPENDSGMSSLASTSKSRSILPSLEDINLDILQLKPLRMSQGSPLPMPRLNLNSYKAKLAIPKSLPLKPVIIESSVKNKKGMIGASMTFGNEKNGILPKYSSKNTASSLLGNPIVMPTFEDLRENFLENAQNLLSTPLETTGRNIIEDTLRSGQVLSENLKVQAKNAVSDLHKNLQSSLKGAGLSNDIVLGNSLKSSDILDEITRKHEDLGDKLKGIHYDFSDRLETLRNNILEHIPSLDSPMARQSSNVKTKHEPLRLSSKGSKSKKPAQRSKNLKKTQRAGKGKNLNNMLSSPSENSPRFIENKKPITNNPQLSIPNTKNLFDIFHKPHSSSLRKSFLKPKESKVKITFETTPRPVVKASPAYDSKTLFPKTSPNKSSLRSKSASVTADANESPSQSKAVHTQTSLKVPIRAKSIAKPIKEHKVAPSVLKSRPPTVPSLKKSVLEPLSLRSSEGLKQKSSERTLVGDTTLKPSLTAAKSPSWPRIIDDSFLTRVREALKARFAGLGPVEPPSTSKLGKASIISSDMARSASTAVEAISTKSESMKENASYSCQMVCTKNS